MSPEALESALESDVAEPGHETEAVERAEAVQPSEPVEPAPATTVTEWPEDEVMVRKLRELPREVGVMLLSVGTLGFVLPGVMGTPAILAGGLVLWPKAFGRLETWFERRYPMLHHKSMKQIGRFLDDLDRRYPHQSS